MMSIRTIIAVWARVVGLGLACLLAGAGVVALIDTGSLTTTYFERLTPTLLRGASLLLTSAEVIAAISGAFAWCFAAYPRRTQRFLSGFRRSAQNAARWPCIVVGLATTSAVVSIAIRLYGMDRAVVYGAVLAGVFASGATALLSIAARLLADETTAASRRGLL